MRRIVIEIDAMKCEGEMTNGQGTVLSKAGLEMSGPVSWTDLLTTLSVAMQLDQHTPPGMPIHGDMKYPSTTSRKPWEVKLCGFGLPGYGWGFWLPKPDQASVEETCCGFCDATAATRAVNFLRSNLAFIEGDPPGGTFEVFRYAGHHAFLDLHGMVHSFSDRPQALSHAAKLESTQVQHAPQAMPT